MILLRKNAVSRAEFCWLARHESSSGPQWRAPTGAAVFLEPPCASDTGMFIVRGEGLGTDVNIFDSDRSLEKVLPILLHFVLAAAVFHVYRGGWKKVIAGMDVSDLHYEYAEKKGRHAA